MSRADIALFFGHLQRHAHKRHNRYLKIINCVLRNSKRVKTGMFYKKLVAPFRMVVVADAAYRSNEELSDCHALR
eukprot:10917130-Prorocentrum_lima.AAC.1